MVRRRAKVLRRAVNHDLLPRVSSLVSEVVSSVTITTHYRIARKYRKYSVNVL